MAATATIRTPDQRTFTMIMEATEALAFVPSAGTQ